MNLFAGIKSTDNLNPNYKGILEENSPYLREIINRWASGFVDRDNKFAYEFQTTFNSSFWELYIFTVLKHLNLSVDFSHNSPDFVVKGHKNFNIEATTANHSKDGQAEWIRNYSNEEMKNWSDGKIVNNATIRLAGSFISKSNKFPKSYSKLDHVRDCPFVLAIAPFDSPYFYLQGHQAIRRVLFWEHGQFMKCLKKVKLRNIY
ncbi:hypothetical protein FZD47_20540 [Bacillus infantis]|uniref:Restriction endonuclease n=1 Tax=Bacillus infantis TaxID=324767 RepID=A0A5D4SC95_9BACI|nr:hypothetical protein [Bacillus infantis]TYS60599.1 hypothetical protein FZD47_20540 [Bacillus infantis]